MRNNLFPVIPYSVYIVLDQNMAEQSYSVHEVQTCFEQEKYLVDANCRLEQNNSLVVEYCKLLELDNCLVLELDNCMVLL